MNTEILYLGTFGIFLIIFYFIRLRQKKHVLKNGIKTTGRVIDLSLEYSEQTRSYYPIVRFSLNDGTWITEKYSVGTLPASFKRGEDVELIYNPNNPTSFFIINKSEHIDKVFLAIGISLILYSTYLFLTTQ
jgi:hypothetical protein